MGTEMQRAHWIPAFAALSLGMLPLAACSSNTEPDDLELRIGVILDLDIEEPGILVPDTVGASTSFTVEVRTIGNGCARQGETRVDRQGATIVITPYDYHYVGPLGCEDIMLVFPHEVELEAGEPGALRVEIVGRPWSFEEPVTLVREVEVTPPAP